MSFSPNPVSFSYATGTSVQFQVSATPGNPSEFAGISPLVIEITDSQGVLQHGVLPILGESGNTFTATLQTSPALAPGNYQGNFQVVACTDTSCSSQVPGSPWSVPYNVTVTPGKLTISDTPIVANVAFGSGAASVPLDIQGAGLNWSVTTSQPWVQPGVASGSGSQNITLKMSSAGLALGTYTSTVTVTSTDGQTATENVFMYVVSASTLNATALQSTSLIANAGTVPLGVSYQLQGQGLNWSVSTNASWLQPSVSTGSGSGEFALNFKTAGLAAGTYSATATVTSTDGQSVTLPVSLTVYGASTPLLALYAGQTSPSSSLVDGPAALARFNVPYGLITDASGNLYVGSNVFDSSLNNYVGSVQEINSAGVVSTFVGGPSQADFVGTAIALAADSAGNLYVTNGILEQINKVTPAGSVLIFAAKGTGYAANTILMPGPLAVDSQNNLYVVDYKLVELQKIAPDGTVTAVAQLGNPYAGVGTPGSSYPTALAVDQSGNILVADMATHTIRKVTPTGQITDLAGQSGVSGSADGTGTAATFSVPGPMVMNAAGDFYVVDSNCIRKVTAQGVVTTIAGTACTSTGQFSSGTLPGTLGQLGGGLALRGTSLYFVTGSGIGVLTNVP